MTGLFGRGLLLARLLENQTREISYRASKCAHVDRAVIAGKKQKE